MARASKVLPLVAILLLVLAAGPLLSTNIAKAGGGPCPTDVWVAMPPLGNDLNPGTPSQPLELIQTGIDIVCAGGTVHVAAGTYDENLHIYKNLTMIGSGAPSTIIDGDENDRVLHISSIVGQTNTISGFTIQNGHISGSMAVGGGVYVGTAHIVTLNDCTIRNNVSEFLGGGVYNAGQTTLNRCTVSGNSAAQVGGGIANFVDEKLLDTDATMSLVNCTIFGNSVGGPILKFISPDFASLGIGGGKPELLLGGGVYNGGDASFLNVTIANNIVSADTEAQGDSNFFNVPIAYAEPIIPEPRGGGFANVPLECGNHEVAGDSFGVLSAYLPTAIFKNTIVANNLPENGYNDGGTVVSSGHNLDSENSCHFNQPTDLINTDPLLGPLQDNDGPTFTCALPDDSPAINAGDNNGAPDTDQRGVSRPQGPSVDIGAFELVHTEVIPTIETDPSTSTSTTTWTRQLNPPNMSVQFVNVYPQQTTANQPVTISTNVVNAGDQGGSLNVALKINGKVEQTKAIAVGPQAAQQIKFTVTKSQPGTYSVDIGGITGSFIIQNMSNTTSAPINGGLIVILIVSLLGLTAVLLFALNRRPT